MTKKTIQRTYVSACANGDLELLREMISKNNHLLEFGIGPNGRNGLFYAVRNLKYNTTDFLLNSGLTISDRNVGLLIHSEWRGSLESYKFVNHFKGRLCPCSKSGYKDTQLSPEWIFKYYKSFCISNNEIKKFLRILEYEKFEINSQSLTNFLNEYVEYKKNSSSPSYISNLRELQLKILLLDQ